MMPIRSHRPHWLHHSPKSLPRPPNGLASRQIAKSAATALAKIIPSRSWSTRRMEVANLIISRQPWSWTQAVASVIAVSVGDVRKLPECQRLIGLHFTVSCTIWDGRETKKAEMSVLDISSAIIERVEAIPETCDYIYIGLAFSIVLSLVPAFCRLCEVPQSPRIDLNPKLIYFYLVGRPWSTHQNRLNWTSLICPLCWWRRHLSRVNEYSDCRLANPDGRRPFCSSILCCDYVWRFCSSSFWQ